MEPVVVVALITAAVTALGWLVTSSLSRQREERKAKLEANLAFVERQLEELYGPLVALMYEGRQIFQELLRTLGRNHVFTGDQPLSKDEQRTWVYWAEKSFLPRNKLIRDLLTSKPHLVEGKDFPKSYITFLQHQSSWAIHHQRWLDQAVTYQWHAPVNWPTDFEQDVIQTFKALKTRHSDLLGILQGK